MKGVLIIVGIGILSALGFWLFQFVWNAVVFGIFGLWRPVSFWESVLIWLLLMAIGQVFRSTVHVRER
jgi:hypothetical protein